MERAEETTLRDYAAMLRRHWLIIVAGLLLGVLVGYVATLLAPVSYTATTSVIVRPTAVDGDVLNSRTNSGINLDTEAQLVTSSVVGRIAATNLGTDTSSDELRKQVTVRVPANTAVLDISFTAGSPEAALEGSQAFASAYLQNRTDLAKNRLSDQATALEQRITSLQSQLREVNRQISAAGAKVPSLLVIRKELLVQQIRTTTGDLNPLYTQDVDPGEIITDGQLPTAPTGWSSTLLLASGALLGLLLGLVGATVRERLDERVRSTSDLTRSGLNVLVGRFGLPGSAELAQQRPHTPEPMRQLRNALLALLGNHRGSITVTAASDGPAGSVTAASLATALARSGIDTILVAANTRSTALTETFGVPDGPGLADALRSDRSALDVVHQVGGLDQLFVVPPGKDGVLFSELLEGSALPGVLEQLEAMAEIVVLDVAPTSANADAQTLVTHTDGLLLVVTEGVTRRQEVDESLMQLTHVNANLLGAVLVSPPTERRLGLRRRWLAPAAERLRNQTAGMLLHLAKLKPSREAGAAAAVQPTGDVLPRNQQGAEASPRTSLHPAVTR